MSRNAKKSLCQIAPPNISSPRGLYWEFALESKNAKWQISFPLQASPIAFEMQISLRT